MEICPNCFADNELRGLILASRRIGTCSICKSAKVSIIDISELHDFFQELIDNYTPFAKGQPLKSIIQGNWRFFTSLDVANKILNLILPNLSTDILSSEDLVDYSTDIIENFSYWEKLKEELKWSRRFILNIELLTEELAWDSFFNTQFELKPNDNLFRARVHHQSGLKAYEAKQMMTPEPQYVSGGRANPSGIPYLYLSDNAETVLYEVRASYLDELSIATFNLKEEHESVKIVDFTEDTALFQPSKINETIKAKLLRDIISRDLSKPMRRYDTEIEYIPTQFICEFIKVFTGASGIRFKSSLHPSGKNIVVFDQNLMECTTVELKKVHRMKLEAKEHK